MTKRTNLILFISIPLFLMFWGCNKEEQTRLQTNWSAKDPILIPFNIRNNERSMGNLVKNPSFETGKLYYEKGNLKSYDITGWKKVGDNIKWLSINNGDYSTGDVYEGKHAIKVERNNADETELAGEGIISDFIKVIPGNYSFKVFLKLENICPNQARIGTKMYDAVNLRLEFYDKNKIRIHDDELDAFRNRKIDNSFKSLTLCNFWQIEKLGWGEVQAKAAYYPFYDGDIPDEARYVKIYMGLKGTGSMWIDQVDFRYTSNNFTMLERMRPYFDSSYYVYDLVFPQPKQLVRKEKFEFIDQQQNINPIILIPENASKQLSESARELKNKLISMIKATDKNISAEIEVVNKLIEISETQFIISVGKTNLYKDSKAYLPDTVLAAHKKAYYIYQLEENPNVVFVNASNDEALNDAFQTFKQLFDTKSMTYHGANIIDYPDISERAILMHSFDGEFNELNSKLKLFSEYKLSDTYFEWYQEDTKKHFPFNTPDDLVKVNKQMNFNLMLDLVRLNAKQLFMAGKPLESIKYKSTLNKSDRSILILGDYYQANEACNQEKVAFYSNKGLNRNLQFDHIKLLNDFNKHMLSQNLSLNLEFLSPWNRLDLIDKGQGQAEIYYSNLSRNIPEQVRMCWTGGTYYSESIDYAESARINDIIGHTPIFMDNSLLANEERLSSDFLKSYYAGKIRTMSIFEPYSLNIFDAYVNSSNDLKTILNTNQISELNTIRILTASNGLWNSKTNNPDKSLWIVLTKLFGRDLAIQLIHFNDAYYGLNEICQKIEVDGTQFKNVRIAKNFETELIKYSKELENNLENRVLLEELMELKTGIMVKYKRLISADK